MYPKFLTILTFWVEMPSLALPSYVLRLNLDFASVLGLGV